MKIILATGVLLVLTGCASTPDPRQRAVAADIQASQNWAKRVIDEQEARNRTFLSQLEARVEEAKRLETSCAHHSKQSRSITAQEVSVAEEKVKYQLKDPWSARFRNVAKASPYAECKGTQYIGEVNAKNSMGGYTGFSWFTIDKSGVRILTVD
jgi:hypothetical protein